MFLHNPFMNMVGFKNLRFTYQLKKKGKANTCNYRS